MKKRILSPFALIILLSIIFSACVRPASGTPDSVPTTNATLPNPVSTQSQLMKDIIAGTQTAMALTTSGGTPEPTSSSSSVTATSSTSLTSTTNAPAATSTSALPTATAGPPPVLTLTYNNSSCGPGLYICTVSVIADQSVTIQGTNSWLMKGWKLSFTMRPNGADESQGIVVGTAVYDTAGSPGFQVTLTIPDSLRGFETIIVRLDSDDCTTYYGTKCYGQEYFYNTSAQ
ncbi:MAG: hypothetical protein C4545_08900 [Anaerolineaceae bacterium]|jgi:hypothetical protein|nr:MAG: hypothetical protein C4545_08900 [Anaerolineaceae bacterium]